MEYIDFENEVTEAIEELGEVTRSDAQGLVEANESIVQLAYENKANPVQVAKIILGL